MRWMASRNRVAIRLNAWPPHCAAFGSVEHAVMDRRMSRQRGRSDHRKRPPREPDALCPNRRWQDCSSSRRPSYGRKSPGRHARPCAQPLRPLRPRRDLRRQPEYRIHACRRIIALTRRASKPNPMFHVKHHFADAELAEQAVEHVFGGSPPNQTVEGHRASAANARRLSAGPSQWSQHSIHRKLFRPGPSDAGST